MTNETSIVVHKTGDVYWVNIMFNDELMFCHKCDTWNAVQVEFSRLGPFLFDAPLPPQPAPENLE